MMEKPRVKSLYIEITSNCNFNCSHCYNNSGNHIKYEISNDELHTLIISAYQLKVESIVFSGGEPLLYPNILDFLLLCKKSHLDVLVVTNGSLITKEITSIFSTNKIKVQISLDGITSEENSFQEENFLSIKLLEVLGISLTRKYILL